MTNEQGNNINLVFLFLLFITLTILAIKILHTPPIIFQNSNAWLFVNISMVWAIIFLLLSFRASTNISYSRSVSLGVILILHIFAVLCMAHSEN